jgi:hypothetical protein
MPRAPRTTPAEGDTAPTTNGTEPEETLSFKGDLGALLGQARRPQRWLILNPTADTPVPEGAIIQRGWPQEVAGTVVAIEKMGTRFGPMPVYVLDVGRGAQFPLIRFALTSTLLRNAHDRHGVKPGDAWAAYCPGMRQGKDQEYEDWSVVVQKGNGTVPVPGVGASGDEEPF